MKANLSIVAGLLVGIAVAGLLLGEILAFAPDRPLPSSPDPSLAIASATPPAIPSVLASAQPSPSASVATGPFHVGEAAPPLVVPQVGGGTIDLANLKGRPLWINFMATWCPPCQDEFPLMNGFAARYVDTGLVVLAIDVKEEESAVAAFGESLHASFPLGLDSTGSVADRWDAIALPVHFWIDADGIVRDGALGGIGPDVMAAGLKTILPGVDVTP